MTGRSIKSKLSLKRRDDTLWGWIFVLPFLIGFVLIFIKVLITGISFAFSDVSMENGLSMSFVGVKNFKYAFRVDAEFFKLLVSDVETLVGTIPIILIFSLFVAVILNSDIWGRTLFRAIFFLPVIVCTGLISSMDAGNSVLNYMNSVATSSDASSVITAMGDISGFLQGLDFSPELIKIVSGAANNIIDIVNRSGVQIVIFLAGIQAISPQLYEAARVEGASTWVIFWKITLPMIVPVMLVNLIYTFVESLTRDNTELLNYIESVSFTKGEYGYGSAMAWIYCISVAVIMVIIIVAVLLITRAVKKSQEEEYRI